MTTTLSRPKFPFAHLNLAHQISVVQSVLEKCKTSPALPPNDPAVVSLAQLTLDLAMSENSVLLHRKEMLAEIAARKTRQDAFRKGCLTFLGHITTIAQGDPAVIRSVGLLDLTGNHRPLVPVAMTVPLSLRVSVGAKPGEVHLRWKRVRKARLYQIERTGQAGTGFVQVTTATAATVMLEGQPSATPLWYRVAAIGPAGIGPFCDGVGVMAR